MAHSLSEFMIHLGKMDATLNMHMVEAMGHACVIVETEAKRVLGTHDYGWPPLAASTIAQKKNGDTPLLETGDMRQSIEHTVQPELTGATGYVGSNDPKAKYHELGTSQIPPRPFLSGAAMHKEQEVVHELGRHTHEKLLLGLMVP